MRKVALGWLVVMLVVLGLGSSGRAAPPPPVPSDARSWREQFRARTIRSRRPLAAANPGDTIKVQHAAFYEQPLVVNKSLTIIGGYVAGAVRESDLPGEYRHWPGHGASCRACHLAALSRAGRERHVEWFIFENGANEGVAVDSGGTLDLVDSIVQNNGDGGLSVVGATANLLRTEILDNDRDYGGGIYMNTGATVTANDSLIKDNQGWTQGAGVYLRNGSVFSAIEGTRIELNVTVVGCDDGGGIAAIGTGTEVTIDASQVLCNTALTRGGGLYLAGGAQAWIQNGSLVQENRTFGPATGGGGGAHVTGSVRRLHVDGSVFYHEFLRPEWRRDLCRPGGHGPPEQHLDLR